MLRQVAKEALRPSLLGRPLSSSAAVLQPAVGKKAATADDDEAFELLPPGCSIADPSYGHSLSEPVLIYDKKEVEDYQPVRRLRKTGTPVDAPTSRAAAQAKLDQKKAQAADSEPYVYLPPGSSMRDPGYHSMSDPQDRQTGRRVYYRDPIPTLRRK